MKPDPPHKAPINLARFCCLALMVALLVNPVLAAAATSANCNGRCCCCPGPGDNTAPPAPGNGDRAFGCCGSTGFPPCHMASGGIPDTPPALIQTHPEPPFDTIRPLLDNSSAGAYPRSFCLPVSRVDTGPAVPAPPLYLESCRFVC